MNNLKKHLILVLGMLTIPGMSVFASEVDLLFRIYIRVLSIFLEV